jgi:transposase-like protein
VDAAVDEVLEAGRSVTDVAERWQVSVLLVCRWVKERAEPRQRGRHAAAETATKRILRLQAELRAARRDRDLLARAMQYCVTDEE